MPELPEVETTLRGIMPHILQQQITHVVVRHYGLRWPVPHNIQQKLNNTKIVNIERRAKYLLFHTEHGTVILHLGMSGRLRVLNKILPAEKHDHIDIEFANKKILRFTDPRRFGAFLWTEENPLHHPLLKNLGPEPLTKEFSGKYLWQRAQNKSIAIKSFIMDNKNVVGVGNIYAAEALFLAGIHPRTTVKKLSQVQANKLAKSIKHILLKAIKRGGTTLKDFVNSEGKPGYFAQHLKVYGRAGLPCIQCGTTLRSLRLGQRSTVYCNACQPR